MLFKYFIVFFVSLYLAECSDIIINIIGDGEMKSSNSLGSCNPSECDQLCHKLGFIGGVCVGDQCTCSNFKPNQDPVMNLFESVEECNFNACDQLCRRLGFPGGACVGDRCKCDDFNQMTHVTDLFTRTGTGSCDDTMCSLSCIRTKHYGGKCLKDHCFCYKKMKNYEGIETTLENDTNESEEQQNNDVFKGRLFRNTLQT